MSKPTRPKKNSPKKKAGRGGPPTRGYVTQFVHWRSGKLIRASDYGHKAFKIGGATRKK